jgi:hypothetical protein
MLLNATLILGGFKENMGPPYSITRLETNPKPHIHSKLDPIQNPKRYLKILEIYNDLRKTRIRFKTKNHLYKSFKNNLKI